MKSMIILLLLMVLFYGSLSADINQYYTFMSGTQPYVPINGTNVDIPATDCISSPVDIGFPFQYGENVYTQVKISCCGYISFNLSNGNQTVNNLAANYTDPLIAALWDYHFPTSTAMVLLTGSAPNRIFTVQYSGVIWPNSTNRSYNFQIRLHEDSQVDLCYGPGQIDSGYGSASIGINMNPGGQGYFLSVRILPTLIVSSTTSYNTVATYPGEGTVFMFVPTIVGIDPEEQTSLNARLLSTYPNPFHTDTTIAIDLRKDQNTLVNVYDVKVKLVKTLWNGHRAKGQYSLSWDGKDNNGNELPPGLYLLQTKQANHACITKLLKL